MSYESLVYGCKGVVPWYYSWFSPVSAIIEVLSTNVRSLVIELAFEGRSLTYKREEVEPNIEH
jgi:hypothetical protein